MTGAPRMMTCRKCGKMKPVYYLKARENLCSNCFIEENTPTRTDNRLWISVYNPNTQKDQLDPEEFLNMIEMPQRLKRKDDVIHFIDEIGRTQQLDLTQENIDLLAKRTNLTTCIWLIFRPELQIDEVWLKIANAIIRGQLGTVLSAKVSTTPKEENHVICIYSEDYLDEAAVMKVRDRLRALGIEEPIFYKPDIYTYLGIYSGTTHLPAHRYKA